MKDFIVYKLKYDYEEQLYYIQFEANAERR